MKFTARLILTALFALGWSGIASAESPAWDGVVEINAFEANTHVRLDAAFEDFSVQTAVELSGLAGPTSMDCGNATEDNLETCVVRLIGFPVPASLAQR